MKFLLVLKDPILDLFFFCKIKKSWSLHFLKGFEKVPAFTGLSDAWIWPLSYDDYHISET